jgi:hypothetical protein
MPFSGEDTMKKLSKEKKQQLLLIVILTIGALAGLWFGLIEWQKGMLTDLVERKGLAKTEFLKVKQAIENADKIEAQLNDSTSQIAKLENSMASGDLYSWAINTLRQFKSPYKVEIPQFSQIDGPKDVPLLPKFPYKQAALTIGGTAHFYDLGRFVADFENQNPYMRVLNVTLEPANGSAGDDRERLNFRMEIAALVKPSRLD